MIKGVNRRIVEITSTENDYFERAVLFVRAEKISSTRSQLDYEAKSYINSLIPKPTPKETTIAPFIWKVIAFTVVLLLISLFIYAAYYFV